MSYDVVKMCKPTSLMLVPSLVEKIFQVITKFFAQTVTMYTPDSELKPKLTNKCQ